MLSLIFIKGPLLILKIGKFFDRYKKELLCQFVLLGVLNTSTCLFNDFVTVKRTVTKSFHLRSEYSTKFYRFTAILGILDIKSKVLRIRGDHVDIQRDSYI